MNDYTCNSCKKKFSRKWNALRHQEQIHHGLAIIFNKKTGDLFGNSNTSNNEVSEPYEHEGDDEQVILDIFGRLIRPFEELEKALGNVQPIKRTNYLRVLLLER